MKALWEAFMVTFCQQCAFRKTDFWEKNQINGKYQKHEIYTYGDNQLKGWSMESKPVSQFSKFIIAIFKIKNDTCKNVIKDCSFKSQTCQTQVCLFKTGHLRILMMMLLLLRSAITHYLRLIITTRHTT